MTRSKKIFLTVAILFFLSLVALVIDISSKTTFPGSKSKGKVPVEVKTAHPADTAKSDSTSKLSIQQP